MKTKIWSLFMLLASAVPAFAEDLVTSPDGTCGIGSGHTCKNSFFGGCCGSDGKCGSNAAECGTGCQSDYGYCSGVKAKLLKQKRSLTCPGADGSTFSASNGDEYVIECGIDHFAGDLPFYGYTPDLDSCINACSSTDTCVDVSWVSGGANGPCYLKSSVGSVSTNTAVWGAKLTQKATSPVSAMVLSCPDSDNTTYTDTCGAEYVIECGIDRPGYDINYAGSPTFVSSLGACVALCSSTNGCVDISYVPQSANSGPCYLKSFIGGTNADSSVWGAEQISGCTTSTTSSSSVIVSPTVTSSSTLSTITSSTITSSSVITSSTSSISSNATSTCQTAPTLTASTIPGCVPCEGQPGTDQFCGFDINTNWYNNTPKTCNVVYYNFDITNTTASPDGVERLVMLVNGQMPGPAIEASWGDTVVVTVNNKLQNNGTSIHFHGVRQLNNNMNDGVPSITQCPIAPGSSMTYTWVAENYGTSWYHSHFAIQAWEGVIGPMIIDGPHSAEFDIDLGPIQLQDWSHFTVDSRYDLAQNATLIPNRTDGATYGGPVLLDTGLINGMNIWNGAAQNDTPIGARLELNLTPGKKHLLRIINSAIQSTYKLYLDGHSFTVISTDFVPITPYTTNILNINIGQRYNVIVEADQPVDNYFLRADNQQACAGTVQANDIRAIVRYTGSSSGTPTSSPYNYTEECVDEPIASLVPVVPLNPGAADVTEGALEVVVAANSVQLFKWFLSGTTFFSEYNDPTLLDIFQTNTVPDYSGNLLVTLPDAGTMVYVIVESAIPLPHPLHLHGHDFWILAEGTGTYDSTVVLNLANPARRDTALLPAAGFIVLAFETDNPGAWLMHCHIGWHTSMGFALQFVEMQDQIASSGALNNSCTLTGTCASWKSYAEANDVVVLDSGV